MFQALAEKRIGRRDQANAWIWRLAEYTREVHEEYAVQRWPETKRLLGLLVNSSGGAHARNARRLVHAARKQDRRLQAALLAAAVAHTPEAEEVLRGARTRLARKPSALSRELLRNFPKGKGRRSRRRRKKAGAGAGATGRGAAGAARMRGGPEEQGLDETLERATTDGAVVDGARDGDGDGTGAEQADGARDGDQPAEQKPAGKPRARRQRRRKDADPARTAADEPDAAAEEQPDVAEPARDGNADAPEEQPAPKRRTRRAPAAARKAAPDEEPAAPDEQPAEKPKPRRARAAARKAAPDEESAAPDEQPAEKPKPRRARKKPAPKDADSAGSPAEAA
jgi:hypothetical protein